MAATICAWCGDIMIAGEGRVSHGLCPQCSERLLSGKGIDLVRFIELLEEAVALVDDDAKVIAANLALRAKFGRNVSDEEGLKAGAVFECAYAGLPGGCGRTTHCSGCVIRNSVTSTFRTGSSVTDAPAVLNHLSGEQVDLRVSTEKVGNAVLLKVSGLLAPKS